MPDLLGFSPKRELDFDPKRTVGFQPGRPLEFDSRRPLNFEPRRDLGFGRRGVVFRGYVCPICGSLTTETATQCTECGTVFEIRPSVTGPPQPHVPAPPARPGGPARGGRPQATASGPTSTATVPRPASATTASATSKFCAHCGARLWEGDPFCWNCGARTAGAPAGAGPTQRGR